MATKTTISCDICQSESGVEKKEMQCLRHYDSTDGRSFFKHLVIKKIDICEDCYSLVLNSGRFPIDHTVQGYGTIEINRDEATK